MPTSPLSDSIARLRLARAAAPAAPALPVRLPATPNGAQAIPSAILRSALFSVAARGARRYIPGVEICAIDGVSIRYKGEQLDQGDLDIWAAVLHVQRDSALGVRYPISAYSLLRQIGITDTGANRATLRDRIERLVATALTIRQPSLGDYIGSLISWAAKDATTHSWIIEINPQLAALFEGSRFTLLDWDVRRELVGQPLAQWLYGFYRSHAAPYPMKISSLHALCGSGAPADVMSDFAKKLRRSLAAVATATARHGSVFEYEIRDGLICGSWCKLPKK